MWEGQLLNYETEGECGHLLSASELLYYHCAPVAHVVAYEQQLRAERLRRVYPSMRKARTRHFNFSDAGVSSR
jgi:hypothetical protein